MLCQRQVRSEQFESGQKAEFGTVYEIRIVKDYLLSGFCRQIIKESVHLSYIGLFSWLI